MITNLCKKSKTINYNFACVHIIIHSYEMLSYRYNLYSNVILVFVLYSIYKEKKYSFFVTKKLHYNI